MSVWMRLLGTLADTFRIGRGKAVLDASGLTAERTLTLPDVDGTVARTADLGTIAGQDAAAVAITGGTINNAAIGGTAPSSGSFTTLNSSGLATVERLLTSGRPPPEADKDNPDAWPWGIIMFQNWTAGQYAPAEFSVILSVKLTQYRFFQINVGADVTYFRRLHSAQGAGPWQRLWTDQNFDPATKSDTGHAHAITDVTGLQTAIDDSAQRNLIVNGGCLVSHRAAKSVSTAWQFGQVDLIAVRANGTVIAGDIRQEAVASLGSTGQAIKVHGLSMDPSGATLEFRVRIEARDARRLKNRAAIFSCVLFHDFGLAGGGDRPIDWHVTVNKADAADDFTTVTQIATGTTPDVSPNAELALSLAVGDMGDCSHGIEVVVTADVDEAAGNNVYLADLQLEPGSAATAFAHRPYAAELALVHRYLRPCTGLIGKANSGSTMQIPLAHPGMRAAPSYEATAALAFTDAVTADFTQSQPSVDTVHEADADKGRVTCGFFSGMSSGTTVIQRGTGGVILAAAEP